MANTKIFASASATASRHNVAADTTNLAGGRAYALSTKGALAQMAVTGVFNDTFYASAKDQLDAMKAMAAKVDAVFLAQLAVYARTQAHMKDLPAYLCAVLAERDVALLARVWGRVIDNGRMLRNFVQIVRSGAAGRRSLGSRPKKLVQSWLQNAADEKLLAASVGNDPSLADVIRLSHPKAGSVHREAFFKHLLGYKVERALLPQVVQDLEAFRDGSSIALPKVPFELLTSLPLSSSDWSGIALNASWQQTRMNLNTFERHGVLADPVMVKLLADRLRNPVLVASSKAFPYQLLAAFLNVNDKVPSQLVNALQDAMELALKNVPIFDTDVAVLVDTSGSMSNPVTGHRVGATSKVRYVDVAALFASAILRHNENALVVPFDTKVHVGKRLNARDSVMTNAKALANFNGGGTDCGAAMVHLNEVGSMAELVVYVSDNESWADPYATYRGKTSVMSGWDAYKRRVPKAKLVCIDISPNGTSQARDRKDILNVGGFSDEVFKVVGLFASGKMTAEHWAGVIESLEV